jgi:photosystem II stability/assembly factor-like uncharacterized protein
MRYSAGKNAWKQVGKVVGEAVDATSPGAGSVPQSAGHAKSGPRPLTDVVADIAFGSKQWYAATSGGLLISTDRGARWMLKPVGPRTSLPVQSVHVSSNGERILVVSLRGLVFSEDGGNSWTWHDLPLESGGAITLYAQPDDHTLVAIAHNGLYISRDAGKTWQQAASGLPSLPVQDFAASGGVFVASMRTGGLYVSSDSGRTWDRVPGTLADGIFAALAPSNEPEMFFAASATEGLYSVEWSGSTTPRSAVAGRSWDETAGERASPDH